jgi:hypothetical protein
VVSSKEEKRREKNRQAIPTLQSTESSETVRPVEIITPESLKRVQCPKRKKINNLLGEDIYDGSGINS